MNAGFCCSVAKLCPILCDPMVCSTPGLPAPHHLPEFAQVHVRWISDSIQPSHSHAGLSDSKACAHDHKHDRGKGRSHVIQEAKNKLLFFSRVLPQQDWWQDHICVAFSCSAIKTLQAWPPLHKSLHILLQTPSTQKLGQDQWVQEPSYV